jgi:hypothetical protein
MGLLDYFKTKLIPAKAKSFDSVVQDCLKEADQKKIFHYAIEVKQLDVTRQILAMPDKEKVQFIIYIMNGIHEFFKGKSHSYAAGKDFEKTYVYKKYLDYLFKIKVTLDEEDVDNLTHAFLSYRMFDHCDVMDWPIGPFLVQIGRSFDVDKLPSGVQENISSLKTAIEKLNLSTKEAAKILERIDNMLFKSAGVPVAVKPTLFFGDDQLAIYANKIIAEMPEADKVSFYAVLSHAQKASGGKPANKYLDESKNLVTKTGPDKFKKVVVDWLDFVSRMKEVTRTRSFDYGNGTTRDYNVLEFLAPPNIDLVKGLVWMCSQFHDTRTLQTIAALAERSFKKIPGVGPAAGSIGNACLYTLYKSKGLEGIAHLSRLKLRIKQNNTQTLIEKYLQDAAKSEGVSVSEIEDLAVDDYGLIDGKREYDLDGYKAVIKVKAVNDVELQWFKPDGAQLKSVPSVVKEKHKERLKKIKDTHSQIEKALMAQRDRVDRMFRLERKLTWDYFQKHYVNHGLLSILTKGILWNFENNRKIETVIYLDNHWTTVEYERITPDDRFTISLWHPATAAVKEIRVWREFLMNAKIQQPLKQAYREVYLLTEAEVNTRTYSNRMAAHILKQHQFNSLAKTRGWKYSLLGAYDDGRDNETAELNFPDNNLRAEYWVNEVNADNAFNDTGIWNYVATDQVRFVNLATNEPEELVNIPAVIFSEVMRDIDLFVGVASVGNDPSWNDSGGLPAHRDYWQAYSFGELTELAKTRKEILEGLVPRLKIASVSSIKDKFLIVQGKKRTYKIHIGSTNILMEPNDQYLCIVPDRSKKDTTGNLFLPFEGDSGLAVILSKAFLLAEDDKITDSTITSQINRK